MLNEGELFEDRVEMDGMSAVLLIKMNNIDITKNDQGKWVSGSTFKNVREFLNVVDSYFEPDRYMVITSKLRCAPWMFNASTSKDL